MSELKAYKGDIYIPVYGSIADADVYLKKDADKAIAELKDVIHELQVNLEGAKATSYADSVDAGMENRRLKRALWIARAERASDRARIFYFNYLETMLDIDGFSYDSKKKKGHKKLTARIWRIIWLKVERKCRAKAEEY